MKTLKNKFKNFIPYYVIIPFLFCWIWNSFIYNGTKFITSNFKHYDLTTELDKKFPLIPEFILIYFGCFIAWAIFYIMCMRVNEDFCAKFFTFDIVSRIFCGIIFLLLPTCNIRPNVAENGIFNILLRFLYKIDTPDNLFPSIHCLISWNCFIGMRNIKTYRPLYTWLSFISALLVFISTLFTKQHVIADIVGAVIISELCWLFIRKTSLYKYFFKLLKKINQRIF